MTKGIIYSFYSRLLAHRVPIMLVFCGLVTWQSASAEDRARLIRGKKPLTELSFETVEPEVSAMNMDDSYETYVHLRGSVSLKGASLNFGKMQNSVRLESDGSFDVWVPMRGGGVSFLAFLITPAGVLSPMEEITVQPPSTSGPSGAQVIRLEPGEIMRSLPGAKTRSEFPRFQIDYGLIYQSGSNYASAGLISYAPKINLGSDRYFLLPNLAGLFTKDINGYLLPFIELGMDFRWQAFSHVALNFGASAGASFQTAAPAKLFPAVDVGIAYLLPKRKDALKSVRELQLNFRDLLNTPSMQMVTVGCVFSFE